MDHMWRSLSGSVQVHDFHSPVPGAISDWKAKIQFIIESYYSAGQLAIGPDEKIIGRIGIDGTKLWQTPVETFTFSLGHSDHSFAPQRCHLIGVYVGSETSDNLKSVLLGTELNNICSFSINLPDGPHEIEIFFTGDHMVHYRLGECDAPTSSKGIELGVGL